MLRLVVRDMLNSKDPTLTPDFSVTTVYVLRWAYVSEITSDIVSSCWYMDCMSGFLSSSSPCIKISSRMPLSVLELFCHFLTFSK